MITAGNIKTFLFTFAAVWAAGWASRRGLLP